MDSSRTLERAELRVALLLQVIESGLDEARQLLLGNLIENYLELSAEEWERYRRLVARKEYRKVQEVELTWLDRAEMKGKHEALLILLEAKFGPLGEETTARVRAIVAPIAVDACLERVFTANSLDEMELDGR